MQKIGEKDTKFGTFEFFLDEKLNELKLVCKLLKTLSEIEEAFNGAEKPDPRIESPDEAVQFQPGYEKMNFVYYIYNILNSVKYSIVV